MSLPMIINLYKNLYKNIIENEEKLVEITKQAIEADKYIKTTYMDEDKSEEWKNNKKIQSLFRRCRNSIEAVKGQRNG